MTWCLVQASILTWFVVQSRSSQLVPFRIRMSSPPLAPQLPDAELDTRMRSLIDITAADPDKVDMMKAGLCIHTGLW